MGDFKVKFRGVRGSFPVADRNYLRYGGNTACVEIHAGGRLIILDAGTGIVKTGDELMMNYISSALEPEKRKIIKTSVLLSHIHMDHILGLTFFKPLHVKTSEINIFGPQQEHGLEKELSELVFGKTFPIDLGDVACRLNIRDIPTSGRIVFKEDNSSALVPEDYKPESNDITADFYKSYVHPQDGVIIYRITYRGKSVVYATDKESYAGGDKNFIQFAKGCDLLIHDAQYTTEDYLNPCSSKQGYGHSTFDMALEAMKQTDAKKMVFFHYEPDYNDEKLDKIKEYYTSDYENAIMACEDLELNI